MAETIAELVASITGDISGLQSSLKESKNILGQASQDIMKLGAGLTAGFTTPVVGALGAVIYEAAGAEDALGHIDAVLQSTKGTAGMTQTALLDIASAEQKVTRFSDETVLSAESMLLTFTKIGKDVFPDATKATLDLATKFGSVEQASIQVGKALNDPIKGITALRRVGITFSAEQERQIRNFVATNHLADAQKVILNELQTEFGGLSDTMGSTFNGALVRIGNLWSDVLEKFGDPIIKALEPVLNSVADALGYFGDQLAALDPETTVFIAAILGITAAIPPLIMLFGALLSPIGLFVAAIAGVGVAIATNFGGLRGMVTDLLTSLKPALDNVGKAFQGFFDTLGGSKNPIAPTSFSDNVDRSGNNKPGQESKYRSGGIEGNATSQMDFGGRFKVAIEQSLPEIEAAFGDLFNQIGTWFSEKGWPEIQKGISSWATKTKNEISTNLANSVQNAILGLINNIQSLFLSNPVGVGIINAIHNAINWVQTTAPGLAATAGAALKKALDGALAGVGAVIKEGVKAALSALVAGLALIPGAGSVVNTIQGAINAMASGGYADAMKPYMVGEHGAELFIPQTAGRVVPNTDIAGLSGGTNGGQSIAIQTLNVYGVQDVEGLLDELQHAAQNRNMQLGVSYG